MKAAIESLKSTYAELERHWADIKEKFTDEGKKIKEKELKDFRQGFAVLEAAEKVDKKVSLIWLDKAGRLISAHTGVNQRLYEGEPSGIRALLESLPDKE